MLLDDIKEKFKLKNLEVKDNQYEDIFSLYKGNDEYAKLSNKSNILCEFKKNFE